MKHLLALILLLPLFVLAQKQDSLLELKYKTIIAEADAYFSSGECDEAESRYKEALVLRATDVYCKKQLTVIGQMRSTDGCGGQKKLVEKKYEEYISLADKHFELKQYQNAKTAYEAAMAIQPNKQYPKDRIAVCDKLAKDLQLALRMDSLYAFFIQKGDSAFIRRDFMTAKSNYSTAITYKIAEVYPRNQILCIDQELAAIAKSEAVKKGLQSGDRYYGQKQWLSAQTEYNSVLKIAPDNVYAQTMSDSCAKQMVIEKEHWAAYTEMIRDGDSCLSKKQLEEAKKYYQAALNIRPDEAYPRARIKEIEKMLGN
jgi:tetratricopeptide (TPR) repeat protein